MTTFSNWNFSIIDLKFQVFIESEFAIRADNQSINRLKITEHLYLTKDQLTKYNRTIS